MTTKEQTPFNEPEDIHYKRVEARKRIKKGVVIKHETIESYLKRGGTIKVFNKAGKYVSWNRELQPGVIIHPDKKVDKKTNRQM